MGYMERDSGKSGYGELFKAVVEAHAKKNKSPKSKALAAKKSKIK